MFAMNIVTFSCEYRKGTRFYVTLRIFNSVQVHGDNLIDQKRDFWTEFKIP